MAMRRYVLSIPDAQFREIAVDCAARDERLGEVLRDLIATGWEVRQSNKKSRRTAPRQVQNRVEAEA